MILQELLNKPLPFKVDELTKSFYSAEFTAGDRIIRFFAQNEDLEYGGDDEESEWIIEFGEVEADGTMSHGKTGSGNEFAVFSTLKAIIEDFIEKCHARTISFSADKDKKNNRGRVYAKLFQKNLPAGWKLEQDDSEDHRVPIYFMMVKEDAGVRNDWLSLETIEQIWHDANEKIFNGQLTKPKFTLEDSLNYLARRFGPDAVEEAKHGHMLGYCDKEGSRIILRFSKKIANARELLEVVVHEMVHQAEAQRTSWMNMLKDPHGPDFLAWADQVSTYHKLNLRQIISPQ